MNKEVLVWHHALTMHGLKLRFGARWEVCARDQCVRKPLCCKSHSGYLPLAPFLLPIEITPRNLSGDRALWRASAGRFFLKSFFVAPPPTVQYFDLLWVCGHCSIAAWQPDYQDFCKEDEVVELVGRSMCFKCHARGGLQGQSYGSSCSCPRGGPLDSWQVLHSGHRSISESSYGYYSICYYVRDLIRGGDNRRAWDFPMLFAFWVSNVQLLSPYVFNLFHNF